MFLIDDNEPGVFDGCKNGGASTSSSIKTLAAKGWVKVINLEVRRDPDANETFLPTDPLTLNEEQDEAYQTISK
ncbi:hypothetical protein N8604_01775, partial [bacterium]|nr:hypothetical protein [bacterium]